MNYKEYTVKVYENGNREWYQNGQLHREDGPAIERADGTKYWYRNGELHREDGPAIEHADGTKYWFLRGVGCSKKEFQKKMNPQQSYSGKIVEIDGKKYRLTEV